MRYIYPGANSFYVTLLFLLFSQSILAQSVNEGLGDVQVASPEAAAMAKFVEIPVSTFTGVPSVSVPIHSLKEGPLTHSVSLSYHAAGIRVAETASWVGSGWNLNAGGMIARTVQGVPDENANGYLKNNYDYTDGSIIGQVADGAIDGEPDLFTFNVGGLSGKFIIDGSINDIIQYPASGVRIEAVTDNLAEFVITGPDGVRYLFGSNTLNSEYHGETVVEKNPVFSLTGEDDQEDRSATGAQTQRIEWYLRRIESHDRQFHIDFHYRQEQYAVVSPGTYRRAKAHGVSIWDFSTLGCDPDQIDWSNLGIGELIICMTGYSITQQQGLGGLSESQGQFVIKPGSGGAADAYANLQKFKTSKLDYITTSLTRVDFEPATAHRTDLDHFNYSSSEISIVASATRGDFFHEAFNF